MDKSRVAPNAPSPLKSLQKKNTLKSSLEILFNASKWNTKKSDANQSNNANDNKNEQEDELSILVVKEPRVNGYSWPVSIQ